MNGFGLINMSRPKGEHEQELRVTFGRVYDAKLGSFLSADPVIQAPNYTQDLNLYSYAYGNPLKYTDPSGYTESPTPPPDGEHRRSGVRLHSTMNPGYRINFPDSGPGFQDLNTNINGVWVKNSVLKESGYQTFSVSTLQYYLNAGFDIVFQFNETASYALAVDNGVTLGSAAGVTWNDNLANYGFVNGYNKGVQSEEGKKEKFSYIEERFIQVTGILGFSGPTVGISIAKLPTGELAVYWNHGNTSGVDLPSLDIGSTMHFSTIPEINWKHQLNGNSTDYGGSISFLGATVGGNHNSDDYWRFGEDYFSISVMLNLGPTDIAGGANKNTVTQKYLFSLPYWLTPIWYY